MIPGIVKKYDHGVHVIEGRRVAEMLGSGYTGRNSNQETSKCWIAVLFLALLLA